jgi:hypothetical protein
MSSVISVGDTVDCLRMRQIMVPEFFSLMRGATMCIIEVVINELL